jgi:hypothetical protein
MKGYHSFAHESKGLEYSDLSYVQNRRKHWRVNWKSQNEGVNMANVSEMQPTEAGNQAPPRASGTTSTMGRPRGRPPNAPKDPDHKAPEFFARVAAVPEADWGTRACIYVYMSEPVVNPKTFGENRYLLKSSAPLLDLEWLKQEYGSFRGWMTLNLRKVVRKDGEPPTDEIDRLNFEIYDPKFPPKIPRAAWVNDTKNRRWEALLPPEPTSSSAAAASLLDSIKVYKEIRNEVKQETPEPPDVSDQTKSTLETMKLAKELFGTPASTIAPKDPLELAVSIATTMTQMRAENPMVEILRDELKAMREAAEKAREREFQLQKEILDAKAAPKADSKSMLDQLLDFAADDQKLERVKRLAGIFGLGEVVGRTVKTTGFDVVREIFNSPFGANLGQGLGTWLSASANGVPVNGTAPNPAPQFNPPGAESDQARIQRIASAITNPMINEFFDPGEPGDVFAERVFDMWPDDFRFLQRLGADTIVGLYREHNQQLWTHLTNHPKLGNREQAFRAFVKDFCTWNPDQEPATAAQPVDDGFTEDN